MSILFDKSTQQLNKTTYIGNLDILRLVMAFWVFIFHIEKRWPLGLPTYVHNLILQGPIGMSVFFILSGFCLSLKYKDIKILKFYISRFNKIYPVYLIVSFLSLFFYKLGNGMLQGLISFLVSMLLLQSWFPFLFFYYHNDLTWFLSSLVFLYLIYPFLLDFAIKIASTTKKWAMMFTLTLTYFACSIPPIVYYYFHIPWREVYILPIFRMPEFFLGILLAQIYHRNFFNSLWRKFYIPISVVIMLYLAVFGSKLAGYTIHNFFIVPLVSIVILGLATSKHNILKPKLIKGLGTLILPFYLFQGLPVVFLSQNHDVLLSYFPFLKYNLVIFNLLFLLTLTLAVLNTVVLTFLEKFKKTNISQSYDSNIE